MLTAPFKSVVQTIALLPDALRPGVFAALVVLVLWFVFVQRGLPSLWHALCRLVARLVDALVGLLLLPDYMLASARHRRRDPLSSGQLAAGQVAERLLDSLASLYERHVVDAMSWRKPPWKTCVAIVVACAGLWVAMDRLPVTNDAKRSLADTFEGWREVEAWADVDSARRAKAGMPPLPRPVVAGVQRGQRVLAIALRCPYPRPCRGQLALRTSAGAQALARPIRVGSRRRKTVRVAVPRGRPYLTRRVRVSVVRGRR
jgi:hypothetical protein